MVLTRNSSCKAKAFSCLVILRNKYACIKVREVKIGEMTEIAVSTLKPIIPGLVFIDTFHLTEIESYSRVVRRDYFIFKKINLAFSYKD